MGTLRSIDGTRDLMKECITTLENATEALERFKPMGVVVAMVNQDGYEFFYNDSLSAGDAAIVGSIIHAVNIRQLIADDDE